MEVRQARTVHGSSLGFTKDRHQGMLQAVCFGGVRDDAQAITPEYIPSMGGLHKSGLNCSRPHEITSSVVPRRRTGHHDIRRIYQPASVARTSRG